MVLVFGERLGGRIDGHEGQYGCTRFFHILFLPIIPTAGLWAVSEERDEAHETRYNLRSIVSGYLRTWGPALTIGQIYWGGSPGVVTYTLLGLAFATYKWWNLRGRKSQLMATMTAQALGSACPTRLLTSELAKSKLDEAEGLWAKIDSGRTLQDVARFGPESEEETAFALTILGLRIRVKQGDVAQSEALVDAILEGVRETSALDLGGPMRARTLPDGGESDLPETPGDL